MKISIFSGVNRGIPYTFSWLSFQWTLFLQWAVFWWLIFSWSTRQSKKHSTFLCIICTDILGKSINRWFLGLNLCCKNWSLQAHSRSNSFGSFYKCFDTKTWVRSPLEYDKWVHRSLPNELVAYAIVCPKFCIKGENGGYYFVLMTLKF